ncbi:AlkA N-terminal domain-containing protein [Polaromonas sp.]|uniref:DNA-3-methyladenine glycosylase 2 family protein n=1 Tax=Polaromonas sp. TaxID=1869339 RepID=UPI0025D0B7E1|nr:AlkA N-terminal domain-containing protein [Polaromonas sp.]
MTTANAPLADKDCYLALKARDARFDGSFFTAVTSTGIYCRPVCSAKTPKRENCRFFRHAAQAEQAGFRPCLRCRPELAPHSVLWSIQDASYILAHQAARLLDEPDNWAPTLVASRTALPPKGALRLRPGEAGSAAPAGKDSAPTLPGSRGSLPTEGALRLRPGGAGSAAPAGKDSAPTLPGSRGSLSPEGAECRGSEPAGAGLDGTKNGCVSQSCGLQGLRLRPGEAGFSAPAGEERLPGVIAGLANRLGVSDRHVRRIFEAQFGVSPVQYLQTRRLHSAKQLLADTNLPITQVALISGFASVRRFNAAFVAHYQLNPTQMRRQGAGQSGDGITVRLGYRPPYDVAAMLEFFTRHAIPAIEFIADDTHGTWAGRTFCTETGGKPQAGWLLTRFDEARCQLVLRVSDSLRGVLPLVIHRVRALFDLDADPAAINSVLHASFPAGDGLRVPGSLDGYELAVRAVLGQQITVAAARTMAQRLVERFGEPIETPWPHLTRLFPAPAVLASASGDALGQLGIVKQRQLAIVGIARAVADKRLQLHGGADVQSTLALLKALPGIGDWTAQYIAMRALRWPDAFPAGDVALQKALGVRALKNPARQAEQASLAWKPWRSYAVIRAWSTLGAAPIATKLIAVNARPVWPRGLN